METMMTALLCASLAWALILACLDPSAGPAAAAKQTERSERMDKSKEKEKLMDLIVDAKRADPETGSFTEWLAAFLLDHGVMVPADDVPGADRLRELIQADREGRCFVFLVPPDRNSENADVVICDDGEEYLQRVYEVDVGKNSAGEMNCIYLTNGGPDFETADIGKTVFLPHETDKIEAALAKMREEGCE